MGRSVERAFDEQLDARLNRKDRNKAPKESADPTSGGLDPTTAGTAPSEDLDDRPADPTAASTPAVTAAGAAIEGPKQTEILPGQATDESAWKFAADTPPTDTTNEQPSAPESSDASGWKASLKPVARPAVPDVHPAEKLVNEAIEKPLPLEIETAATDQDPTTQAGQAGHEGPAGDPALAEASGRANVAARTESSGSPTDAIVAARFQRAYEGQGAGDPTSEEQHQRSDNPSDPSSPPSANDDGTSAADVVSASQPPTVSHDTRSAIITTLPPSVSGVTDPVRATHDPSALGLVETPEPDTADRLVQSFRMQFLRGGGDAVVHIRPEHLGPLTVSVRVEHGTVSAHVTADNPIVAEWLQANEQMLRDSLKAAGLILERLVIHRDPEQSGGGDRRDPAQSQRHQRRRDLERQSTFEVTA